MTNRDSLKEITIFFLLYTLSSILFISNFDGLYWDDWCMINQEEQTINTFMNMIQHGLKGIFVKIILTFDNPLLASRTFIYIANFITAIMVYFVLKTIKQLNKDDIFYLTLLYLIMPVASSKIAPSIIPFFFPVLIFFVTFFFLSKYLENNLLFLRILVLIGFYLSFDTNSILVFYGVVLLYIFYKKYEFYFSINNIKNFSFKCVDFILLPIVFFVIKIIYFKPYGSYEGYNSLGNVSIIEIFLKLIKSVYTSLFDVLHQSLYLLLPFSLLLSFIIFLYIKKWFVNKEINSYSNSFFYIGFVLFFLAIFPYVALSKLPQMEGFSTRYQLLTPLGLAFIFYFGINLLVNYFKLKNHIQVVLLIIVICSFIGKNLYDGYKWQVDSLYMTSIMMNFKDNQQIQNNATFIVNNNIRNELMYKRKPPFYEWNGMLKQVFKDESRLMITFDEYKSIEKINNLQQYKQYNFNTWGKSLSILVQISYNYKSNNNKSLIYQLLLMKFTNYALYLDEVKKLTMITVSILNEKND